MQTLFLPIEGREVVSSEPSAKRTIKEGISNTQKQQEENKIKRFNNM